MDRCDGPLQAAELALGNPQPPRELGLLHRGRLHTTVGPKQPPEVTFPSGGPQLRVLPKLRRMHRHPHGVSRRGPAWVLTHHRTPRLTAYARDKS
jgi:hypothetical protein